MSFVSHRWRLRGRPTYCIILREEHMKDPQFPELLNLLLEIRNLKVDKVKISLGRLQNLMSSACVEHLDFSGSFNINELEIEPFAQIQHSLYENQNFSEMAPPKIIPEDVNDYTVSLIHTRKIFREIKCGDSVPLLLISQNFCIFR